MLAVLPKQTHSMRTRDGVRLDADVYYPEGNGPFPVLLMRQPYGRAIASTIVYAPPSWYAAHGYIVVIQDVRGRGTSEGEFSLFANEVKDGVDTVRWAAALPKSSGAVGMYGFSYQGMTQLYAAIGLAREVGSSPLKTICPAMLGYDLYHDWAYEGGAFCLQTNWGWAVQLAAETARRQGDAARYKQLYAAARGSMDVDPVSGRSPLLETLAPDSFYHDWLNNPSPNASYWQTLSPHHLMKDHPVDLPMLHIGGWFDTYLRGTLRLYREMVSNSQCLQSLLVGPWPHLPWGRHVGDLDFGSYANSRISSIDLKQICWFDTLLGGNREDSKSTQIMSGQTQLFLMGGGLPNKNDWVYLPTGSTPCNVSHYYLRCSGLVSTLVEEGGLVLGTNADGFYDTLIHDPWRPVPALGGHATFPAGPKNRTVLDERTDILTYTIVTFRENTIVSGEVTVELYCKCDSPSFDLCAVLSDVYPEGQVYGMAQGYQRVIAPSLTAEAADKPFKVCIALQSTCLSIQKGHALRLSISGACYPAYAMNSGTGSLPGEGELIDAQVMTIEIHSSKQYPSKLILPVVDLD
ncbi:MAG: CocE/NonD family hydrolase [Merismopedia sp. SIO2A8]|nr:CocE/NonD family hydrolase [Merismopedia sp. SIO2A8]